MFVNLNILPHLHSYVSSVLWVFKDESFESKSYIIKHTDYAVIKVVSRYNFTYNYTKRQHTHIKTLSYSFNQHILTLHFIQRLQQCNVFHKHWPGLTHTQIHVACAFWMQFRFEHNQIKYKKNFFGFTFVWRFNIDIQNFQPYNGQNSITYVVCPCVCISFSRLLCSR